MQDKVECPHCKEMVKAEADGCPNCGGEIFVCEVCGSTDFRRDSESGQKVINFIKYKADEYGISYEKAYNYTMDYLVGDKILCNDCMYDNISKDWERNLSQWIFG